MFRRAWVPENSNLIMSCPLGSIPVHKSFSYQFFFLCKWPLQQMVNIYEKSPTWPLVSQILANPVTASLFFSHPERADWVCLSTSMNEVAGHNFPYFSCPTFSLPQVHQQHLWVKLFPSWCYKRGMWAQGEILHAYSKQPFPRNLRFCLFKTLRQVMNFSVSARARLAWDSRLLPLGPLLSLFFFPFRTFIRYHDNGAWRESYHWLWEN